jgi:PKD repeat protein
MERAHEKILGTILAALGVGILLFGFFQAYEEIRNLPPASQPPLAGFNWSLTGSNSTARFVDNSRAGSSSIVQTYWSFGDGNTSSATNPWHTYGSPGRYTVVLAVEDTSGNVVQSNATINVNGVSSSGTGSPSLPVSTNNNNVGSFLGQLFGGTVSGALRTIETFLLLIIEYLVGGAILRAGWNLITPKAETIQVRVKPKSLQVEPVGPPISSPVPPPAVASPVSPPPVVPAEGAPSGGSPPPSS